MRIMDKINRRRLYELTHMRKRFILVHEGKPVTDEKGRVISGTSLLIPKSGITKESYATFNLINEPINKN